MTGPSYMPHGYCFAWDPRVFWPLVVASLGTALAYATIPLWLAWIGRRRPDLVPPWFSWPFRIFIASCGLGHVLDVIVLWWPVYELQAWWACVTAASSLATAVAVWVALPRVLGLVSAADLERAVAKAVEASRRADAATARAEAAERALEERR